MPPDKRAVCPVTIGRGEYLHALERFVGGGQVGREHTLLVSGEAGVGKSRLVAEGKRLARERGLMVLQGNCFETDRTLPYAPLLDMLRAYMLDATHEEAAESFAPFAEELVKILPAVANIVPGVRPAPSMDPESEKRRLFEVLFDFVGKLAEKRPLLVVLEDLHWADDTSLEFLLYAARRIEGTSVLLALSFRSDEANPVLRHMLADMDRERLAAELALSRLAQADVEAMLRAIFELSRPVRSEFVEALYELTEGNPFFIEEVCKALVSSGEIYYSGGGWERKPLEQLSIPRSVQDAVGRRVERLRERTRETLVLAAVMGRRFDFEVLQRLTGQDERDLLDGIKELVAAQLVIEESADRFAFRHALTREAIYSELLARERRSLHRQVAETIDAREEASPDSRLSELAYHYFEAGVWEKALHYSSLAGERAQALYTPRSAAEYYSRAIEAAKRAGVKVPHGLLRARAQAYETLGEFEPALADLKAALERAREAGDKREEWEVLLDAGKLWASRDYSEAGRYFDAALELSREVGDRRMLAHSLNRVGNWNLNTLRASEALVWHREALEVFAEMGDRRGEAETCDLLGMASYLGGDTVAGTRYYRRAVGLFREMGDRQLLSSSLASMTLGAANYQSSTLVTAMSPAEPLEGAEEALTLAQEIGWRSGEAYARVFTGFLLGPQGEYARALENAIEGLRIAEEIEHKQWIASACCAIGGIYLDLQALEEAGPYVERAYLMAREIRSPHWVYSAVGYLGAYLNRRDPARAMALYREELTAGTLAQALGHRLAWAARAQFELQKGNAEECLRIVGDMLRSSANLEDGGVIPRLWLLRGEALLALRKHEEARELLEAGVKRAEEEGQAGLLWRLLVVLGKACRQSGRGEEAGKQWQRARELTVQLADKVPEGALREVFVREAGEAVPGAGAPTARQAEKKRFGGLTAREREVAALIAQGMSNREIADSLIVGTRTVETYVTNILSKLGLQSRSQIAVWSVENGLAGKSR